MKKFLLISLFFCMCFPVFSQTPGMIVKPALSPGNSILDPDGDGYVSAKTDGVQQGFTIPPDDDVAQSEIPYVPLVRPDPTADILRGPVGGFIEIVGTDAAGNDAIMIYSDGNNILFRFRLGGYAPNTKSYSLLIDADQKFGFTGVNADPNALTGNPGFEAEIVLSSNFSVDVYNVDGLSANGKLVKSYAYETNCQKSVAVSMAGGDPDYFYDFYVKESDISALFTGSTPLRMVALTTMNNQPAIGNNSLSDVGGADTGSSIDIIYEELIEGQTPTAAGSTVLDRSACPTINAVASSASSITGTTTEASGTTIHVYVYQSNGTTLVGSGSVITTGSSWSIAVSALGLPGGTLLEGYIVKATATAVGKGTSYDNCSIKTVTSCSSQTAIPASAEVVKISGGKGYDIVLTTRPVGTLVYLYNSDFSLRTVSDLKNGITNPFTTTSSPQTFSFECQTGYCFGNEVYYVRFQEPGKCISPYYASCDYATGGTTNTPVITTPTITTSTTTISGTGTQASSQIIIYADGNQIATTTSSSSSPYSWSASVSGLSLCQIITARQIVSGQCISDATTGITVSRQATKPLITTTGCSVTPPTTMNGSSAEVGATITLYRTSPSSGILGTAIVQSGGGWSISGLSLSPNDVLVAAVTSGACLSASVNSDPITITAQTNLSDYTITINNPLENATTVTGSISGGTYPVTLKVYEDQTQTGSGILISAGGSWSVTVPSGELYISGVIQVSLTQGSNCESELSSISATVQCVPPSTIVYTGGNYTFCYGNAASISLTTSETGVVYQLVNSSGTAVGPSSIGTGSGITLYTYALIANLSNVYVKAYKIGYSSCSYTSTSAINFTSENSSPSITLSSNSVSVEQGTTSVNLPFSAKSTTPSADTYTINYSLAANNAGFVDVTVKTAIASAPGDIVLTVPVSVSTGTYTGTLTIYSNDVGATCTRSYGFSVTVYEAGAVPVISIQPQNARICSGNTASLSVTAQSSSGMSYQWQSATSYTGTYSNVPGGTTDSYTTAILYTTTYYRVIVTNSNGSTLSNVATVTVNQLPDAAGVISGISPVCSGQSSVSYSIAPISGATSYNWTYSGTNVTISGSSNSVSLNFAANASSGTLSVVGNNSCGSGTKSDKTITVNTAPVISNMTANSCSGANFSTAPVDGVNGTVPVGTTYSWGVPVVTGGMTGGASGSNSSAIIGNLTNTTISTQVATYTVTPTLGSCSGNPFTVTVNVNPQINLTATPVAALCYGSSTGNVNLTITGGTPSYSYSWTGPNSFTGTTQNLSGVAVGTYSLTITDSKSCTASTSAVVTQPGAIVITPSVTNVSCYGSSTGAISIAVTGGIAPYTFLWNDGSSLQNRSGLPSGTYSVTATDANGCKQIYSGINITQPDLLSISGSQTNIACFGKTTGAINVSVSGGTSPYTYDWNDVAGTDNPEDRSGLLAGTYSLKVTDSKSCTALANFTLTQPSVLSLNTLLTNESCPGRNDGEIDLTVSGGVPDYSYNWSDLSSPPEPEDRTGLPAGSYTVNVADANGCEITTTVTIADTNPSPVTPGTISK